LLLPSDLTAGDLKNEPKASFSGAC